MERRKEGWYRVKHNGRWYIAHFFYDFPHGDHFRTVDGDRGDCGEYLQDVFYESELEEINETPINPNPKPVLTKEEMSFLGNVFYELECHLKRESQSTKKILIKFTEILNKLKEDWFSDIN